MGKRRLEKIERIPNSCHRKVSYINHYHFGTYTHDLTLYVHYSIFHMIIIAFLCTLYLYIFTNYKNGKIQDS